MQKKLIPALCVIFFGLFFFSCSDPILPKQVEIKGGTDLPVRMGVADFSTLFMEVLQSAFSSEAAADEGSKPEVFYVVYDGQTIQTFCIHLPIEMSEDLNPNSFLKTINRQISNDGSSDPLRVEISLPFKAQIPINDINAYLPPISVHLDEITYVRDIDFAAWDGTDTSGIGINFYVEEIRGGLEMVIECNELGLTSEPGEPNKPRLLQEGNNIFGNKDDCPLKLNGYADKTESLVFTMRLQSADHSNTLDLSAAGFTQGEKVTIIKGEVRFFQNWTEATIDMEKAIKAERKGENFVGTFPNTTGGSGGGFDFSGLGDYLDGEFTFDGLETNMYMNNPVSFEMSMDLKPQYEGKEGTGSLYSGEFSVDKEPFVLSAHLEDGNYTSEHLPGVDGEYNNESMDDDVIADIFAKMPANLIFEYTMKFKENHLPVKPHMFDNSEEHSKINMALMIMLPLRLIAITDGSAVIFPDMFGGSGDLFGRAKVDKNGYLFGSVKINKIKMTIDFMNTIFSGGHLFIDGDRNTDSLLFYPDGVKLSGKSVAMDFTNAQMEIVQANLIKPNFWVKLDEGDTVTIPMKTGIMGVKFELNGNINIGELFE